VKALSLFANVGLGETYLPALDVEVVVANEMLPDRARFYSLRNPDVEMVVGDITDTEVKQDIIRRSLAEGVELIIATPPCQGFSAANTTGDKDDERNNLINDVVDVVKATKPAYVLIENVRGSAKNVLPIIFEELGGRGGYVIREKVLDAAYYGTPHHRARLIILLSRNDKEVWEHPPNDGKTISCRQVIGHLPSLEAGESTPLHFHSLEHKRTPARHSKWLSYTPEGKSALHNKVHYPEKDGRRIRAFDSSYARNWWDKPAFTITMTNGSLSSSHNCCPPHFQNKDGTWSDARPFTIKELTLLCGLPENWLDEIEHTPKTEKFLREVIGECFPPMFCYEIVKVLMDE